MLTLVEFYVDLISIIYIHDRQTLMNQQTILIYGARYLKRQLICYQACYRIGKPEQSSTNVNN